MEVRSSHLHRITAITFHWIQVNRRFTTIINEKKYQYIWFFHGAPSIPLWDCPVYEGFLVFSSACLRFIQLLLVVVSSACTYR